MCVTCSKIVDVKNSNVLRLCRIIWTTGTGEIVTLHAEERPPVVRLSSACPQYKGTGGERVGVSGSFGAAGDVDPSPSKSTTAADKADKGKKNKRIPTPKKHSSSSSRSRSRAGKEEEKGQGEK